MNDWSANQYVKFEDERTRPARDLLAHVPLDVANDVADLGCGPGNSTQLLTRRFPEAEILGVDNSPDMLGAARERLPQCKFVEADLAQWQPPRQFSLLFANATFQWVPDHPAVLGRLLRTLPAGGVLAVQMPDNLDEPSHVLMRETAQGGLWAETLKKAGISRAPIMNPNAYYDLFRPHARAIDIWHTIYNHPLADAAAIVAWVEGTGLRPYISALPEEHRSAFIADYTARIAKAYPRRADGRVLLRFPRIFMIVTRG